jgi:hypothetical protein
LCGFLTPPIIASIIRRPLTPMMSLITESSLMLASSSQLVVGFDRNWRRHLPRTLLEAGNLDWEAGKRSDCAVSTRIWS